MYVIGLFLLLLLLLHPQRQLKCAAKRNLFKWMQWKYLKKSSNACGTTP